MIEDEPEMFDDDGALSRAFLLRRGSCCGYGCKNCPYERDEKSVTRKAGETALE